MKTTISFKSQLFKKFDPELGSYLFDIGNQVFIHSPLMIKSVHPQERPEDIQKEYDERKRMAKKLLAKIKTKPLVYLQFINKPYRWEALLGIEDQLSDRHYWECLAAVYVSAEFLSQHKHIWLHLLKSKRPHREAMMEPEDREAFSAMPEELTIFRGYQFGRYNHKMGLSWTLSREKAIWFAHRNPENGTPAVVEARCKKKDAFCYITERGEQEIVIDPANVKSIKRLGNVEPHPTLSKITAVQI